MTLFETILVHHVPRRPARGALLAAALALAASGCGEDVPVTPDAAPASADAAPDGSRVTLATQGPPLLVTYRNVDGAWQPATKLDDSHYELYVRGPYLVTVVCAPYVQNVFVAQLARTLDDDRDLSILCNEPEVHRLRGGIKPADELTQFQLAVGTSSRVLTGTSFDVPVPKGTVDVMALLDNRVAFRRGIAVTADTTLANAIDFDREGVALASVATTITNALADERISNLVELDTGRTYALVHVGLSTDAAVIPETALLPADIQTLHVGAIGAARRSVRRVFREGGSTTFTLPDPIGPVSFSESSGSLTATWSTLVDYDTLKFSFGGNATGEAEQFASNSITATASYVAARGLTNLRLELDVPGLHPAWRVDLAQPYTGGFSAQRTVGNDTLSSGMAFSANQPPEARATSPVALHALLPLERTGATR